VDWLFSDVICYPDRLLEMVRRWMEFGECRNFVCTVKLQGDDYMTAVRDFAAIPGSRLMHLSANKHELTWVKLG
jgi:23S rRNA (cytidine2498-2'-O)-methyltransferase